MVRFFEKIFSLLSLNNTIQLLQDSNIEEFMVLSIAMGGTHNYYAITKDEEVRHKLAGQKIRENDRFWWWRTPSMTMLLDTYLKFNQ